MSHENCGACTALYNHLKHDAPIVPENLKHYLVNNTKHVKDFDSVNSLAIKIGEYSKKLVAEAC